MPSTPENKKRILTSEEEELINTMPISFEAKARVAEVWIRNPVIHMASLPMKVLVTLLVLTTSSLLFIGSTATTLTGLSNIGIIFAWVIIVLIFAAVIASAHQVMKEGDELLSPAISSYLGIEQSPLRVFQKVAMLVLFFALAFTGHIFAASCLLMLVTLQAVLTYGIKKVVLDEINKVS